jgi:cell division protein FtsL
VTRLNVVLLLVLLFSSVYLVRVSHESRRLFAELDKAHNDEHLLDNEFERLKSDKQSQATPLRVEKTARAKLAMRSATPAVTQYVNDPRVAASSGAPSVPRSMP